MQDFNDQIFVLGNLWEKIGFDQTENDSIFEGCAQGTSGPVNPVRKFGHFDRIHELGFPLST